MWSYCPAGTNHLNPCLPRKCEYDFVLLNNDCAALFCSYFAVAYDFERGLQQIKYYEYFSEAVLCLCYVVISEGHNQDIFKNREGGEHQQRYLDCHVSSFSWLW